MEPDRRYGMGFLEATRRVKDGESLPYTQFVAEQLPSLAVEEPPPTPKTLSLRSAETASRALAEYPRLFRPLRWLYRLTLKPRSHGPAS